jgi:hypothetical protein
MPPRLKVAFPASHRGKRSDYTGGQGTAGQSSGG